MDQLKTEVKKGDIVEIVRKDGRGWGFVIGEVYRFNAETKELTLDFPSTALNYGSMRRQTFCPVSGDEIKVLTASEVFKEMASYLDNIIKVASGKVVKDVERVLGTVAFR